MHPSSILFFLYYLCISLLPPVCIVYVKVSERCNYKAPSSRILAINAS